MFWVLIPAVVLVAWLVFTFSKLVRIRFQTRTAWADIDVQRNQDTKIASKCQALGSTPSCSGMNQRTMPTNTVTIHGPNLVLSKGISSKVRGIKRKNKEKIKAGRELPLLRAFQVSNSRFQVLLTSPCCQLFVVRPLYLPSLATVERCLSMISRISGITLPSSSSGS